MFSQLPNVSGLLVTAENAGRTDLVGMDQPRLEPSLAAFQSSTYVDDVAGVPVDGVPLPVL
jgi:hypothetical protein